VRLFLWQNIKTEQNIKAGDKNQITHIPNLILIDFGRGEVINIEGKENQIFEIEIGFFIE